MDKSILQCCDCKEKKENSFFYRYKNGFQKRCKDCTKQRNRKFQNRRPEYYKVGGKGYSYDQIADKKKHNADRYARNKNQYELYNEKFRQTPRGSMYSILEAIRGRVSKQGYSIDFDLDYLMGLYEEQDCKCAATQIPFDFSETTRRKRFRPFSVSIDRIDSNGKYEKTNIRLVCVAFNLAVNAFGDDTFRQIAVGFLENNKK